MRKILGTRENYCSQINDASVKLFKDYTTKAKYIACGPNSAAMGFEIAGWPMDVFTPGEQASDSILMVMENPKNLEAFKVRRDIDYDAYPVNEVAQCYDVLAQIIYKDKACWFEFGLSFDVIRKNILAGIPLMICGQFPAGGHYVLVVGFDEEKEVVIYNDPYPLQWPDKNGYNREMTLGFLRDKISPYRVDFLPYKK